MPTPLDRDDAASPPPARRRLVRHAARLLPGLVALALAAFVLRSADLPRVLALVGSLGWRLPLLLLPNFAVTLLEGVAWWGTFARLGHRPGIVPLVGVRLVTEATMLGLPSGAVVSESLQPWLLKRRCGVSLETALVASVGRKFLVVVSHGIVLVAATLLAWPLLARVSREAIGRPGLPWMLLAVSAFMFATFGAGLALSGRARLAERTRGGLARLGGRWLGPWLERHAARFERTDDHLVTFFERDRAALLLPMLLYCAGWVVRGAETWLFLRLLGTDVSFLAALVVETAIILVRSAAVPVPAGLGVQDVAYVLTFRALGLPDATTLGAAFVLLKRGRDLFWVLVGFALFALGDPARGQESRGLRLTPR